MNRKSLLARLNSFSSLLIICAIFASCRNDENRPETIQSLRALGVSQTPSIAIPNETVKLKFYLAGPSSLNISAAATSDARAQYSSPAQISTAITPLAEETVGPLSLYAFETEFTTPNSPEVAAIIAKNGYAKVRYAVNFISSQGDEKVVGDTIILAANERLISQDNLIPSITKPLAEAQGNKISLEASLDGSSTTQYRVSWYVSSGSITNRRALATTWESPSQGNAAVFFTIRDVKSGFFALESKAVSVSP